MLFREHQAQAQRVSRWLVLQFALLLVGLVVCVNLGLAGLYRLVVPHAFGFPDFFFAVNTILVVFFVLGGCWVETKRLRDGGGARVAHWLNARLVTDPADLRERRLFNLVDEMALASGVQRPTVYVMEREDAINAFVAGWSDNDAVLVVTRGALERLTRDELQGVIAHEYGHIHEGDLSLNMRLVSLVWGLSLLHGWGLMLMDSDDDRLPVSLPGLLVGGVFVAVGWLGWFAGRLLQAGVSRQRELLADACAVQYTRSTAGLGNALRKILYQQTHGEDRLRHPQAQVLAAMLIHAPHISALLATHPPLAQRIRQILGHDQAALEATRFSDNPALDPMPVRPMSAPLPPGALASVLAAQQKNNAAEFDPTPFFSVSDKVTQAARDSTGHQEQRGAAANVAGAIKASAGPALGVEELDARARLALLHGPAERQAALLALMLSQEDNRKEELTWAHLVSELPNAVSIREDIKTLSAASRLPLFELLLTRSANTPKAERRAILEATRKLMSADGRVWPWERLRWLTMRHQLSRKTPPAPIQPGRAAGAEELNLLSPLEQQPIAAYCAFLARMVPDTRSQGQVSDLGLDWFRSVLTHTCPGHDLVCEQPDTDALAHALWGLQELSWQLRPVLLRVWLEEAEKRSENHALEDLAAEALRMSALLLNTPMPPTLAALFSEFDAT